MWLLLAFLAVPLIEIALFIQVGGAIGLWPTLAIVVGTALLGTYLVRQQGAKAMGDLRGSFRDLRNPTEPLAHGAMILVSAALLLTPGFFTDVVGFALLVPQVRQAVLAYGRSKVQVSTFQMGSAPGVDPSRDHPRSNSAGRAGPTIVEGEYQETDPLDGTGGTRENDGQGSGWTRH